MFSVLVQTLCLAAAGYALWLLWTFIRRHGRIVAWIVALGFAGRSIAGQVLFWVSYLRLPYGRSMQLGDGLWFFGVDALHYYRAARVAAVDGLGAVLTISPHVPSVWYVKLLGLFLWLFGAVASTAVFLNLAAYLGTVALALALAEHRGVSPRVAALTVAAISILPSMILWSLQPLKDAFVFFLAVLFAFLVDHFARTWSETGDRRKAGRLFLYAALIVATTYALAGIRWYYALILLAAAAVPMLAVILSAPRPAAAWARAGVVLALAGILTQTLVAGAGPYLPAQIRDVLRPWRTPGPLTGRVEAVADVIDESRENFDRYAGAATRIGAGRAVEADRQIEPARPSVESASTPAASESRRAQSEGKPPSEPRTAASERMRSEANPATAQDGRLASRMGASNEGAVSERNVIASTGSDPQRPAGENATSASKPMTSAAKSVLPETKPLTAAPKSAVTEAIPVSSAPKPAASEAKPVASSPKPAASEAKPASAARPGGVEPRQPPPASKPAPTEGAPATPASKPAGTEAKSLTPTPETGASHGKPATADRKPVESEGKRTGSAKTVPSGQAAAPVPRKTRTSPPVTVTSTATEVSKAVPSESRPGTARGAQPALPSNVNASSPASPPAPEVTRVPTSRGGRMVVGLAALLLPRKVGDALGLVSIGGGRGLMWFADVDTILFNVLLIACVAILVAGMRQGAWRDAFVWYLVIATIVIAGALAYTVSNYGTLFRHRQMVVATLALIGIAAARPRQPREVA